MAISNFVIKSCSSKMEIGALLAELHRLNRSNHIVQLFDPSFIISRNHVEGAYANSIAAFRNKTNRTKGVAMEMLLFAAFTDQIGMAIKAAGAKSNSGFVLFCDRGSLKELRKFVEIRGNFKPSTLHAIKTAKRLGIKNMKGIDIQIFEKMAASRL